MNRDLLGYSVIFASLFAVVIYLAIASTPTESVREPASTSQSSAE